MKEKTNMNDILKLGILIGFIVLTMSEGNPMEIIEEIAIPHIQIEEQELLYETSSYDNPVSIKFPTINFQISSEIFLSKENLTFEYTNKSNYNKISADKFCQITPSDLKAKPISVVNFKSGVTALKIVSKQYNFYTSVFALESDRKLRHYIATGEGVEMKRAYDLVDVEGLRVENGQLLDSLCMVEQEGYLYLFLRQTAYRLKSLEEGEEGKWRAVSGYQVNGSIITGCGEFGSFDFRSSSPKSKLYVSTEQSIYTFQINPTGLQPTKQAHNITSSEISSILFSGYRFILTTSDQLLHILNLQAYVNNGTKSIYNLHGLCSSLTMVDQQPKQTLYIGCQYERINYVMEIILNRRDDELKINRYYDDRMLEGVRKVQGLGFGKIGLLGDNQVLILGHAINSNVLFDLERKFKYQNEKFFYSHSLIDFINLPQLSNSTLSKILTITTTHFSLYQIKQSQPQVKCIFPRSQFQKAAHVSILVAFNTSACLNRGSYISSDGNQICEVLFPFNVCLGVKEYEDRTAKFILLVCLLVIVGAVLICSKWGLAIRSRSMQMIMELEEKLEKARSDKGKSQL